MEFELVRFCDKRNNLWRYAMGVVSVQSLHLLGFKVGYLVRHFHARPRPTSASKLVTGSGIPMPGPDQHQQKTAMKAFLNTWLTRGVNTVRLFSRPRWSQRPAWVLVLLHQRRPSLLTTSECCSAEHPSKDANAVLALRFSMTWSTAIASEQSVMLGKTQG
jgi:hypothetical protein